MATALMPCNMMAAEVCSILFEGERLSYALAFNMQPTPALNLILKGDGASKRALVLIPAQPRTPRLRLFTSLTLLT
jgi:hypothetical protein